MDSTIPSVLFVCTGNAARSVMAAMMLQQRSPATSVASAGTHVIEGQPMSWRTRDAIVAAGFEAVWHRSRQLTEALLDDHDLVVAMAGEHVAYIRRHHPRASRRTATLKWLCAELPRTSGSLDARLEVLDLSGRAPAPWEDVADPAGAELPEFIACAREIRMLVDRLLSALATAAPSGTPSEAAG
jgi:protein-tyrosine-phosphatase